MTESTSLNYRDLVIYFLRITANFDLLRATLLSLLNRYREFSICLCFKISRRTIIIVHYHNESWKIRELLPIWELYFPDPPSKERNKFNLISPNRDGLLSSNIKKYPNYFFISFGCYFLAYKIKEIIFSIKCSLTINL